MKNSSKAEIQIINRTEVNKYFGDIFEAKQTKMVPAFQVKCRQDKINLE